MLGSLQARILSGSFWSIAVEVFSGGARVLSYIVYARVLSPTDFGLLGFCLLWITLFPLLIDNSLSLALIRSDKNDQRTYSVIFFLNVGLAIIAIAVLCLAAPWVAKVLHDTRVAVILPALSVQLLFNALCSVHMAVARRRFQYRQLVPVRLISTVCSLACGLPLAFLGYGYWALVSASLIASLSQMIAAWTLLGWRPSLEFDWRTARGLSGFTSWVAVDMGITWMVMSGGGFFLAFFLGAHELGLFRLSDQINTYLLGSILNPLIPVLYSAFCEASAEPEKWWRLFERSTRIASWIAIAMAGAIVIAAHPLEAMIGAKWRGVGDIVVLNAVADAVSFAILPIPSLLRAQGHAKAVAGIRIAAVIGQVLVYSQVAAHGLHAFVIGKLCLEVSIYVASYATLHGIFARPTLRLIGSQVGQVLAVSMCTIPGIVAIRGATNLGTPIALTAGLLVFFLTVVGCLLLLERQSLLAVLQSWQAARG